jgi:hypothetical protein
LTQELKWKLFVNGDYGRLIACAVFAAQRQMSNLKKLCPTDGENGTTIFCYGDAEDEHVEELGRRMAAGQFSNVTSLRLVSYFCFDVDNHECLHQRAGSRIDAVFTIRAHAHWEKR